MSYFYTSDGSCYNINEYFTDLVDSSIGVAVPAGSAAVPAGGVAVPAGSTTSSNTDPTIKIITKYNIIITDVTTFNTEINRLFKYLSSFEIIKTDYDNKLTFIKPYITNLFTFYNNYDKLYASINSNIGSNTINIIDTIINDATNNFNILEGKYKEVSYIYNYINNIKINMDNLFNVAISKKIYIDDTYKQQYIDLINVKYPIVNNYYININDAYNKINDFYKYAVRRLNSIKKIKICPNNTIEYTNKSCCPVDTRYDINNNICIKKSCSIGTVFSSKTNTCKPGSPKYLTQTTQSYRKVNNNNNSKNDCIKQPPREFSGNLKGGNDGRCYDGCTTGVSFGHKCYSCPTPGYTKMILNNGYGNCLSTESEYSASSTPLAKVDLATISNTII